MKKRSSFFASTVEDMYEELYGVGAFNKLLVLRELLTSLTNCSTEMKATISQVLREQLNPATTAPAVLSQELCNIRSVYQRMLKTLGKTDDDILDIAIARRSELEQET